MTPKRGALLFALLGLVSPMPSVAQEAAAERTELVVPALQRSQPFAARVARISDFDIPQDAKDEGHNGSVTWTAEIGADGKLVDLVLKRSSNSAAIDEAGRLKAAGAYYFPATDRDGSKVAGTVDVRLEYARWDKGSPGGGIDTYLCSDLNREAGWFAAANADNAKIFALENFFVSLPSLAAMEEGTIWSRAEREASRKKRGKEWKNLLRACGKRPDALMLDMVKEREFYRMVVQSF